MATLTVRGKKKKFWFKFILKNKKFIYRVYIIFSNDEIKIKFRREASKSRWIIINPKT